MLFVVKDLPKPESEVESLVYRARRQMRVAEHVSKRMRKVSGAPKLQMSWDEGTPLQARVETADATISTEMAVAMAPLLLAESDLYIDRLLDLLAELTTDAAAKDFIQKARDALARARTTKFPVSVNGQPLDAGQIFADIAKGITLAGDIDAIEYHKKLDADPIMGSLKSFMFHHHSLDVYAILASTMAFLEQAEGRLPRFVRDNACIYCKRTDGPFTTSEHTLPESLGNYHSILPRGYVCDGCQANAATFETDALAHAPFSMLRVLYAKQTKKGKFPTATFKEGAIERTSPNSIRFTSHTRRKPLIREDGTQGDQIRRKGSMTDTRVFEHIPVARVILKGILGAMALENGRDYVLDPRFDGARDFIRTGTGLKNRMAIIRDTVPDAMMQVDWQDVPQVCVAAVVHLFGVKILVGMTQGPHLPPHAPLLKAAAVWDLWETRPGPHHSQPGNATSPAPSPTPPNV